ncbi:MAG: ABC transporter permease [Deltaproteobacteria bacterium]|nr:ABC transporter permease [Deltaproteobacteria bacterium]
MNTKSNAPDKSGLAAPAAPPGLAERLNALSAAAGVILLIARRELSGYFSGLSGTIILATHLLINGLLFNIFAVGNEIRFSQQVLEEFFYYGSGVGMITAILLGVRLIAEERQLKTLVLLRTSPISERQLVWGKFASALAFFTLTLLLSLYMPALIFLNGKVSLGQIGAGYLGLWLLGGACIAITLLASVWSPSQLVAGVVAGLMVTLLLVSWKLAQVTEEPLKGIFYYSAIHNLHFRAFSRGLINLRDVVYYLAIVAFFLELAVSSMAAWRWRE